MNYRIHICKFSFSLYWLQNLLKMQFIFFDGKQTKFYLMNLYLLKIGIQNYSKILELPADHYPFLFIMKFIIFIYHLLNV